MNREILFRGKRVDNGEWVYGWYVKAAHHWHKRGVHEDWIICAAYQNGGWFALGNKYPVDPSTIGQFTGLTDKNGVKIFEGDVVKARGVKRWSYRIAIGNYHPEGVSYQCGIFTSEVKTMCGVHGVEIVTGQECFFGYDPDESGRTQELEIIGNVHDNPELLGEKT